MKENIRKFAVAGIICELLYFTAITLFLGIKDRALKIMSLLCGVLCFAGFSGSFFFDYLWYTAILGYGLGLLIMCIYLCVRKRSGK